MHRVVKKIEKLLKKYDCVEFYKNNESYVALDLWGERVYWRKNIGNVQGKYGYSASSSSSDFDETWWDDVDLSSIKPYTRSHKEEGQRKGESNYEYIVRLIEKGNKVSAMDYANQFWIGTFITEKYDILGKCMKDDGKWNLYTCQPQHFVDFTDIKIHIEEEEDEEGEIFKGEYKFLKDGELEEKVGDLLDDLLADRVEDAVRKVIREKFN